MAPLSEAILVRLAVSLVLVGHTHSNTGVGVQEGREGKWRFRAVDEASSWRDLDPIKVTTV